MATLGSRSLFHTGNAVKLAAEDARAQLERTRQQLGPGAETPIADVFKKKYGMRAGSVTGVGNSSAYTPRTRTARATTPRRSGWSAATRVDVEVDTETGRVKVTRLVNVADVGTPIHPRIVENAALGRRDHAARLHRCSRRCWLTRRGSCVNASLAEYKIPGLLDLAGRDRVTRRRRRAAAPALTARRASARRPPSAVARRSPQIGLHDAIAAAHTELPLNRSPPCTRRVQRKLRRAIQFTLHGERVEAQVAPHRDRSWKVLRARIRHSTARARAVGRGCAAACTVIVDGRRRSGCLYLATLAEGAQGETVERAAPRSTSSRHSCERSAFQCGFCSPGFVLMNAPAYWPRIPTASETRSATLPLCGENLLPAGRVPRDHRGGRSSREKKAA